MGSLGTGEILVIAVVALIVFGPKRLPELACKAGEMLAKARDATKSVTSALDSEYDGITAPLQDLKSEYDATVKGIKDATSTATGFSVDMSSPRPESSSESDNATGPDADSSPDVSSDESTDTQNPPDDDTTPHDAVSDPETGS